MRSPFIGAIALLQQLTCQKKARQPEQALEPFRPISCDMKIPKANTRIVFIGRYNECQC